MVGVDGEEVDSHLRGMDWRGEKRDNFLLVGRRRDESCGEDGVVETRGGRDEGKIAGVDLVFEEREY